MSTEEINPLIKEFLKTNGVELKKLSKEKAIHKAYMDGVMHGVNLTLFLKRIFTK